MNQPPPRMGLLKVYSEKTILSPERKTGAVSGRGWQRYRGTAQF
jgi:hypothetical protein